MMVTDGAKYTRLIFWLKFILGVSSGILFFIIFVFSYSKEVSPLFNIVTNDVRIGLKYQARDAHITGNTSDGGAFDLHAKALNPSHKNDKIVILSKPLGEIFFSSDQKFNFTSDFASLNLEEKNILFNGNLSLKNSWGTTIKTEELIADFRKRVLTASRKVLVETNFVYLESGGMEYYYSSNGTGDNENIFFTNGVKVEISID